MHLHRWLRGQRRKGRGVLSQLHFLSSLASSELGFPLQKCLPVHSSQRTLKSTQPATISEQHPDNAISAWVLYCPVQHNVLNPHFHPPFLFLLVVAQAQKRILLAPSYSSTPIGSYLKHLWHFPSTFSWLSAVVILIKTPILIKTTNNFLTPLQASSLALNLFHALFHYPFSIFLNLYF